MKDTCCPLKVIEANLLLNQGKGIDHLAISFSVHLMLNCSYSLDMYFNIVWQLAALLKSLGIPCSFLA